MKIRAAEMRDLPRIAELLLQVHLLHAMGRPDIFRLGSRKYTDEELEQILEDPKTPVFVAVDDCDCVCGYAFCIYQESRSDSSLCDRKTLYIDDLCVDQALRGQHIGSDLFSYVKNRAKESGCDSVTLNVWSFNAGAMRFYEAQGMRPLKVVMESVLDKETMKRN